MIMSTTSQTIGAMPAPPANTTAEGARKESFFQVLCSRFIASREREATRRVAQYLAIQSDDRLADLGFSADQIGEIRRTGSIPASYYA